MNKLMDPVWVTRMQRIKQVFNCARRLDEQEGQALVRGVLANDSEALAEASNLLRAHHAAGNFLKLASTRKPTIARVPVSDRFEFIRPVGSGGFSDVYKARDRATNEIVAVKILRQLDSVAIVGLKDEARFLQGISHRNVARVDEYIEHNSGGVSTWMLRMELVAGIPITRYLKPRNQAALRECLCQTADGISALHNVGLVHRDIKPANILVKRDGTVKVLDFGLTAPAKGQGFSLRQTVVGTPAYIAPEQLAGAPVDASADWYSFGTLLYELLFGRVPFEGEVFDVVAEKRLKEAVFPEEFAAPADLVHLCRRLLNRTASERPDGPEIMQCLSGRAIATAIDRHSSPATVPFVGREKHLELLAAVFEAACLRVRGATIHLHGEPGAGKSRLAAHFLESLRSRTSELLILQGRCYQSASLPFTALDEIVDRLFRYLKRLPTPLAQAVLPRNFELLVQMFPVLGGIDTGVSPRFLAEQTEYAGLRSRAFNALKELLGRLAERHTLVLFLDDMQWADLDSSDFLAELMAGYEAPPLFLLLAYRTDSIGVSSPLSKLRKGLPTAGPNPGELPKSLHLPCDQLAIGIFSNTEASKLASEILGTPFAINAIADADRTPFWIQQLCWYLRGNPDKNAARIDIRQVVRARIDALPRRLRNVLEVVSVSRKPLATALLKRAGHLESGFSGMDNWLIANQLLIQVSDANGNSRQRDVYHDHVRDAVLEQLDADRLTAINLDLALAIQELSPGDTEAIGTHFGAAGRKSEAARYFELAARKADAALAFDRAARLFRQAVDFDSARTDLKLRLANALVNAGEGVEAATIFLEIADQSEASAALPMRIQAATELLRAGCTRNGERLLRELLREVGLRYHDTRRSIILAWVYEKTRLRLRGLDAIERQDDELCPAEEARLKVCWAAAVGFALIDPMLASVFIARHLRLALDAGSSPQRLALAFASEATQCAHADDGEQMRARKLLARAEFHSRKAGTPYAEAFVQSMNAVIESLRGNWRTCLNLAQSAETTFRERCPGTTWETGTTTTFICSSRWLLGHWTDAARQLPGLIREAEQRGDLYMFASLHVVTGYHMYLLAEGSCEKALFALDNVRNTSQNPHFDVQKLYEFYARVEIEIYRKNGLAAWRLIETEWPKIKGSGLHRLTLLKSYGLFVRARAALASAVEGPEEPGKRVVLLREASAAIRQLNGLQGIYNKGLGGLMGACLAITRGEQLQAGTLLKAAERIFEEIGTAPWLAVTRIRRSRLVGGSEGQRLWEAGIEWMTSQGVKERDRMIDTLAPGNWNA